MFYHEIGNRDGFRNRLLPDFAGGRADARLEQLGGVRAGGPLESALRDRSPERRREARDRARVTRRPRGDDLIDERVLVAVERDGEDALEVAREEAVATLAARGLRKCPDRTTKLAVDALLAPSLLPRIDCGALPSVFSSASSQ